MELTEQEKEKAIKFAEDQVNSGWLTPVYMTNPALQEVVLGGCNKTWPTAMDGRSFISFWGGDKGGCCHEASNYYPDSNGAVDVGMR